MQLTDVQLANCSLALTAVQSFLDQKTDKKSASFTSADVLEGISQFYWPGRFQCIIENKLQWFLDGAHNELSIGIAAEWFITMSKVQKY
jgi:folylpolyglutamate synthase